MRAVSPQPHDGPIYCRKCSCDLTDVVDEHCPACGKWFNPDDSLTVAVRPFDPKAYDRSHRRAKVLCWILWGTLTVTVVTFAILTAIAALTWNSQDGM